MRSRTNREEKPQYEAQSHQSSCSGCTREPYLSGTYFGLRSVGEGENGSIVFLMDEGGSIVTLSNFNHADAVTYPGAFHIGFVQQSNEDVDAVNRRLRADGYALGEPKVLHGSYTFYVKAPGGFLVEVLGLMPGLGGSSLC